MQAFARSMVLGGLGLASVGCGGEAEEVQEAAESLVTAPVFDADLFAEPDANPDDDACETHTHLVLARKATPEGNELLEATLEERGGQKASCPAVPSPNRRTVTVLAHEDTCGSKVYQNSAAGLTIVDNRKADDVKGCVDRWSKRIEIEETVKKVTTRRFGRSSAPVTEIALTKDAATVKLAEGEPFAITLPTSTDCPAWEVRAAPTFALSLRSSSKREARFQGRAAAGLQTVGFGSGSCLREVTLDVRADVVFRTGPPMRVPDGTSVSFDQLDPTCSDWHAATSDERRAPAITQAGERTRFVWSREQTRTMAGLQVLELAGAPRERCRETVRFFIVVR